MRLLGDVRVVDVEVVTTHETRDVRDEHAVRARSVGEEGQLVGVRIHALQELFAGVVVEDAVEVWSLTPVGGVVRGVGELEDTHLVETPDPGDLVHHGGDVGVVVRAPSIAR